jgi:hypothetical protein
MTSCWENCKVDYYGCLFEGKINILKCGDNKGPVATFLATLAITLDNAGLTAPTKRNGDP